MVGDSWCFVQCEISLAQTSVLCLTSTKGDKRYIAFRPEAEW